MQFQFQQIPPRPRSPLHLQKEAYSSGSSSRFNPFLLPPSACSYDNLRATHYAKKQAVNLPCSRLQARETKALKCKRTS
jgi:hypothetical protein